METSTERERERERPWFIHYCSNGKYVFLVKNPAHITPDMRFQNVWSQVEKNERPFFFFFLFYLSLSEPLADLLSSQGRRHPFNGDCSNIEEVDSCFCLDEIEDRQLKVLLSLLFSLSSYGWHFGSCWTAVILRASGITQLNIEPMWNI